MSEQSSTPLIPEWDQADRMRKALRTANLGVQELADYLGVSRNTVSTWINGRIHPSTQTLRLVALRCGVPFEWLKDGIEPTTSPDGDGTHSDLGERSTKWYTDAAVVPLAGHRPAHRHNQPIRRSA